MTKVDNFWREKVVLEIGNSSILVEYLAIVLNLETGEDVGRSCATVERLISIRRDSPKIYRDHICRSSCCGTKIPFQSRGKEKPTSNSRSSEIVRGSSRSIDDDTDEFRAPFDSHRAKGSRVKVTNSRRTEREERWMDGQAENRGGNKVEQAINHN